MNIYNFDVNFTTGRIYAPDFILVVNDHNSTLFKFTFDQIGRYVFKLLYPDGTIYVQDITDNQLKLTKGVLNQEGNYKFEISLYGDDNRLTTARIKEFPVRLELVSTDEPVQADDRLPILDNLIEETNKVVEAAKNGDFDGATFTPSVSDNGDLSWTNDKGKENPPTVNIKGEPGAPGEPGAVKMQVVDTLPDVGETDTIYLVKKDTPGEQNLYDEYVYTETTGWEHIGDTSVDLTDYYKKEDFLTCYIKTNLLLPASTNGAIQDINSDGLMEIQNFINDNFEKIAKFSVVAPLNNLPTLFNPFNAEGSTPFPILKDKPTQIILVGYYRISFFGTSGYGNSISTPVMSIMQMILNLSWEENVCTITRGYIRRASANDRFVGEEYLKSYYIDKNNTRSYTPTGDYNPATKKYVDDNKYTLPIASTETLGGIKLGEGLSADENGVVSASSGKSELYTFYTGVNYTFNRPSSIYPKALSADKQTALNTLLTNMITDAVINGNKAKMLLLTFDCANAVQGLPYLLFGFGDIALDTNKTVYRMVSIPMGIYNRILYTYYIDIYGSWVDNVFSVSRWQIILNNQFEALSTDTGLSKTNTKAYTPTGDYNPATKKYVDDSVSGKQDSGPIFFIDIPSQELNTANRYTQYNLPSDFNEGLTSSLQKALSKYNTFSVQFFIKNILTTFYPSENINYTPLLENKPSKITLYGEIHNNGYPLGSGNDTPTYTAPIPLTLEISLSWSEDVPTVTASKYGMYTYSRAVPSVNWVRENTLTKTNTTSFTPTQDYHPSTKKYVDDSVSANSFKLEDKNIYVLSGDISITAGSVNADVLARATEIATDIYLKTQENPYYSYSIILQCSGDVSKGQSLYMDHIRGRNDAIICTSYTQFTGVLYEFTCILKGSFDSTTNKYVVTKVDMSYTYPGLQVAAKDPSQNNSVTPKMYVDNLYKSYTGYDATKTQVLKNVNGTLTWVNEE